MNWKPLFAGYDLNSDGRVTVKEFRRIMVRTGKCRHNWKMGRTNLIKSPLTFKVK